jgi:Family of unknown function (DUF5681)
MGRDGKGRSRLRGDRSSRNRRITGAKRLAEIGKDTRFPPGKSGNPNGRPPTKLLRNIAREIAEEIDPKKRAIKGRILVEALYKKAAKGHLGHFQEFARLLEEDFGTDLRISGPGAGPIDLDVAARMKEFAHKVRNIYGVSDPDDSRPRTDTMSNEEPVK